jgi:hypothetical protein
MTCVRPILLVVVAMVERRPAYKVVRNTERFVCRAGSTNTRTSAFVIQSVSSAVNGIQNCCVSGIGESNTAYCIAQSSNRDG